MTKSLDGKVVCEKHQWPTKDCIMCMSAVYETEQIAYLMRDRIAELEAGVMKQHEEIQRLREALEIIAGKRQCVDNLMGNVEIAMAALLGGVDGPKDL